MKVTAKIQNNERTTKKANIMGICLQTFIRNNLLFWLILRINRTLATETRKFLYLCLIIFALGSYNGARYNFTIGRDFNVLIAIR